MLLAGCRREAPSIVRDDPPKKPAPSAAPAPLPVVPADGLVVDIDPAGALFVEFQPVDDAGLRKLALQASKDPEAKVTVRADARVAHGRVIEVIDLLKNAGIHRIAFAIAK